MRISGNYNKPPSRDKGPTAIPGREIILFYHTNVGGNKYLYNKIQVTSTRAG